MLATILEAIGSCITTLISSTGYVGIAILMAIESACVPLPSEIIMPFAGSLVATGRFTLLGVATAGAVGCNLGSAVAYWVGRSGGRAFVRRWGSLLLISARDLDRAERFFARFGTATVFVGRLLPVVRTFVALPAGFARMPQWRFHIYTFVGSWLWCFALASIGAALGERWDSDPRLRAAFHGADAAILAVIVMLALAWWWHRRRTSGTD